MTINSGGTKVFNLINLASAQINSFERKDRTKLKVRIHF